MRNYSKVYLKIHERMDFEIISMTDILNEGVEYMNTIFFIPADAKMDGL